MLDIYVKRAIIHSFDPASPEINFSESLMDLSPLLLDYVTKKVEKVYSDDAKRGILAADNQFLVKISDDFIEATQNIANFWREEFVLSENQKKNDLLFVEFEKDTHKHIAFIRMSFRENFSHVDEDGVIRIKKTENSLPGAGSSADEAIVINLETKDYHLIEKRIKYNGKNYNYFSENLLADKPDVSINHAIKAIKKTAESVAKDLNSDDFMFTSKVQNAVFNAIEEKQSLEPEDLANQLFADNLTARLNFQENVKENLPSGLQFSEVPTERVEKKLSNQKLSLSNGIELMVPQSLYDDAETVEFIQNEDGTYSIIIKNIDEIKNKW